MVAAPPGDLDHLVDDAVQALAEAYGVALEYWDQAGNLQPVAEATVVAVLSGLGVRVEDTEQAHASMRHHQSRDWRRALPPVFIQRQGHAGVCWVHVEHGAPAELLISVEGTNDTISLEQIDDWTAPQIVDGRTMGQASFAVPAGLPLGWHQLQARSTDLVARCPLVITPDRLPSPPKSWGLMTQIYSVRSVESWGMGDYHDLAELARWLGHDWQGDFLLVNPLHATEAYPPVEPSPYLPASRRFLSPLYLRVEDVPEYQLLSAAARAEVATLAQQGGCGAIAAALIDRDSIWQAKLAALRIVFAAGRTPQRELLFDSFVTSQSPALQQFATWCALTRSFGPTWQDWPEELQVADSAAVESFREQNQAEVRFFMWLQWLCDEQIAAAQQTATDSGLSLGIIHDLAVGVHGEGADAWRLADVLAGDVTVGAPPDMYNQLGQNWAQPPWNPVALAEAAYRPFRDMLRAILRHAGGIRIDHVLGLFRQWWIPEGNAATQGTYVRMDHEAVIGILLLEAHRVGAVVIGEDLGTVEDWIRHDLAERGILGTGVLWFERDTDGQIRPPEDWRADALASVTVHDLPPSEGYVRGAHVELRHQLGLLANPLDQEREFHAQELAAWNQLLTERGLLHSPDPPPRDVVVALHQLLATSPARLLAVSLPDLLGDLRPQNQPGTNREYPNWCVPLTDAAGEPVALEDLAKRVDARMIQPLQYRDRA